MAINPFNYIQLGASSQCQLKCPLCPTGKGENRKGIVGWGHLSLENFKKFTRNNPGIESIELTKAGEIFLNPQLLEIMEYAYKKKIRLRAEGGANLNYAKDGVLEGLVKYRFSDIAVAIDGASQQSYEIYRKGGNYGKVIRNIIRINRFKKKYKSPFPKLTWQFVVFGHNEHETDKAREFAKRLFMDFKPIVSWSPNYSPIRNPKQVAKLTGWKSGSRIKLIRKSFSALNTDPDANCAEMWKSPQINWDGTLLGCCANRWVGFGNVFATPLHALLEEPLYRETMDVALGKRPPRKVTPCFHCDVYRNRIYPKHFLRFILTFKREQFLVFYVFLVNYLTKALRLMKTAFLLWMDRGGDNEFQRSRSRTIHKSTVLKT